MIGRTRHTGAPGRVKIIEETRIDMVAALRRLDEGEGNTAAPRGRPVDIALPARNIDAVNRKVRRLGIAWQIAGARDKNKKRCQYGNQENSKPVHGVFSTDGTLIPR